MKQLDKLGTLGKFILSFLLLYGLIQGLGYVPGIERGYRNHYIKMTDTVFGDFKKEGIVKAGVNPDEAEKELDVMIMLSTKDLYRKAIKAGTNVRIARTYIFTKFLGFLPLSILLALTIATPLKWKQKLFALVSGLVLVELFILFRLWLHLMYSFNSFEWLDLVHLSPTGLTIIDFLGALFVSNVVVVFITPFFIWFVTAVIPFPNSPVHKELSGFFTRALTVSADR